MAGKYGAMILLIGAILIIRPSLAQQEGNSGEQQNIDSPGRQDNSTGQPFSDKLFTGGEMGAWFGNVTYVNLSPLLGYWITKDELAAGVGITYQYYNNKDISFATSIYGGSAFLRYYIGESVFAHGQYEVLNVEAYDQFHNRMNVPALLLGGGYSEPMGDRSAFTLMFLWNFSESRYSPYSNPVIRAGLIIGL